MLLPFILEKEKEKFSSAILCFLLPTIGHHSLATTPTVEQPPEQQSIISSHPAENDFKIGKSRDKMKYKASQYIEEDSENKLLS